ncbi:hypothetical protein DIPPA_02362 [Diplonema papillatum]|nr:hypothetical protein DIPPA_02362 [Diplonema papillatum]
MTTQCFTSNECDIFCRIVYVSSMPAGEPRAEDGETSPGEQEESYPERAGRAKRWRKTAAMAGGRQALFCSPRRSQASSAGSDVVSSASSFDYDEDETTDSD